MEWGPRICQQEIEKLLDRIGTVEDMLVQARGIMWLDEATDFPDSGWQEKAAAVEQFAASEGFMQAASLEIPYDGLTPEVACAVKLAVGDIHD
jgi:hypothetical protein